MKSRNFFESISVAFRMWQLLALSPFSLKNHEINSAPKRVYQIYSFSVMAAQVVVMVMCWVFFDYFVSPKLPQTIRTLDTLTMTLLQLTALVIFFESYKKRTTQIDFLRKINSVDFILQYKIGIHPNYAQRKKTNIIRLCRWLALDATIFITNFFIMYYTFSTAHRWWVVMCASIFICSFRYYQITTYVDTINYRYYQMNEFVNELQPEKDNNRHFTFELTKAFDNNYAVVKKYQIVCSYEKLTDLRRACRLLSSANHDINAMFLCSIPLIITNDFLSILVNLYWTLRILLDKDTPTSYLIAPLVWTFLNFNHIISLSTACHHTTHEVSSSDLLMFYFNYFLIFIWTYFQ